MKIEEIIGDYKSFLGNIFECLAKAGFDLAEFSKLDHMAYRVETLEEYNLKKALLDNLGVMASELPINGRPIAVYKLNTPLRYKTFPINCIELPAPKDQSFHKTGLQHIEFVVKKPLNKFIESHKEVDFETDFKSTHNRCVTINFSNIAVKFHEKPLLEVVKLQEATGQQ